MSSAIFCIRGEGQPQKFDESMKVAEEREVADDSKGGLEDVWQGMRAYFGSLGMAIVFTHCFGVVTGNASCAR